MIAVTVVKDNVVDSLWIFPDVESAEKKFLDECSTRLSNWDEYTQDDIDSILADGYEKFGNGSICLTHGFPEED